MDNQTDYRHQNWHRQSDQETGCAHNQTDGRPHQQEDKAAEQTAETIGPKAMKLTSQDEFANQPAGRRSSIETSSSPSAVPPKPHQLAVHDDCNMADEISARIHQARETVAMGLLAKQRNETLELSLISNGHITPQPFGSHPPGYL
ncbi:unnamed protein product [Protopolystoma xenopodis]|uniref:Uncharacterized protein n=1 Tax=Protopolystoma xenopodis TaxID=117903 RepID=A0A3S5AQS8_9PLAT|nr:unnamed protein product [Protopolystoma xenopodis]